MVVACCIDCSIGSSTNFSDFIDSDASNLIESVEDTSASLEEDDMILIELLLEFDKAGEEEAEEDTIEISSSTGTGTVFPFLIAVGCFLV